MKIGSIGTSRIMELSQDAFRRCDDIDPVCILSRNEDSSFIKKKFDVGYVYSDIGEFLDSDIDTVYIASPNSLHFEQAVLSMQHHKNVLIEKPCVLTLDQLRTLDETAKENDVLFFDCISTLYLPGLTELNKWLNSSGRISSVDKVHIVYGQYSSRYDRYLDGDVPNVFDPDMGGGVLNDLGIYCIYVASSLFGRPDDVFYSYLPGRNRVDLEGTLGLSYPDFEVVCEISKIRDLSSGTEITGDNWSFIQKGPLNSFENCYFGAYHPVQFTDIGANRLVSEFKYFSEVIGQHDIMEYRKSYRSTFDAIDILERAHLSAKERKE